MPNVYVVPSLPVIVSCAASVAVMVRMEVVPLATVVGVAVIVTVGNFRVLLPTKRAHPDKREQK